MTTRTNESTASTQRRQMDIDALVRPNIRRLSPYHCARDDYDSGVLLDANENSMGSPIGDKLSLNRYPDPHQVRLRHKFAEFRHIEPGQVFVGVGSDEVIDLIIRIFCRPGIDNIIITPPTYGMYKVSASINDVQVLEVPLNSAFEPDVRQILDSANENSRLLFLCSPNNPTANLADEQTVFRLLQEFPGLVVVDEAYIDFSSRKSLCAHLDEWPNLVVVQTLSKSFGLAGVRLGIALAQNKIIEWMMKVKAPYNINKLTEDAALKALDALPAARRHIAAILTERKRLSGRLKNMSGVEHVYASEANFLLVRIDNALHIYQQLADKGIIVRYRGNEPHCENCLRITVGTTEENDLLMNALSKLIQ